MNPDMFFTASLIIVGAHYLVFISLYGMRLYAILAIVLSLIGVVGLFWLPELGEFSGWIGGAVLLVSALPLYLARDTRGKLRNRTDADNTRQVAQVP